MAYRWRLTDEQDSLFLCPNHRSKNILYARIYTPRAGFEHSETNQLIHNFKIPRSETHRLDFKQKAIRKFVEELTVLFQKSGKEPITLIPIPTSKAKEDPDYDDRLEQVCIRLEKEISKVRFVPLIERHRSATASHLTTEHRNLEELSQSLKVNEALLPKVETNSTLVLIDDVVTSGAHFEVCRKLLGKLLPNQKIAGVFWAKAREGKN